MKQTVWIMTRVLRYCFKYILGLVLVFSFSSLIRVGVNFLNRNVINELTENAAAGRISVLFFICLICYLVVWLLSIFQGYLEAFANNLFRLKVDVFMQKIFMKKSVQITQERFFETDFQNQYSFVCGNTNRASAYIFNLITILFSNIAVVFSSVLLFAKYEPMLIAYAFSVMIFQGVHTIITSNISYNASKKQIKAERIGAYLAGLFVDKRTAKEMRIYDCFKFFMSKWEYNNERLIHERIKIDNKQIAYNHAVEIINVLLRFISIYILLFGVTRNKYDTGTFVMLFGLAEVCVSGIRSLTGNVFSGIFGDAKYFKDYYEIVAPIDKKQIAEALRNSTNEDPDEERYFTDMKLENITFTYPNADRQALKGVDLHLKRGEIVSILGYNGSGKTTLSKVLSGAFTEYGGNVKLNGNDISGMPKASIYRYFGIAPQEYTIFSLSIRDNVSLGCIEKMNDDDELEIACQKAGMQNIIGKFPLGDATILGKEYSPDGVELSGGESQRIILASAYMGSPEILLLDEPTASIDPIHEVEILKNFREILSGKTAVLISHRIGFARLADRIVIMKEGRIVEEGSHDDLLAQNGFYAEMFNKQKKLYE